jgi:2-polyprenyl-3-methyl-5-hydroxy-6-metoxy-1,4-benzoquinol methylase
MSLEVTPVSSYHDNCRTDALQLLGPAAGKVLDVGCGSGATGRALLEAGRADLVDGIELSPSAAERSRADYRRVVVGDIDQLDLARLDGPYDTLLCLDVLEHVRDPWAVLRRLVGDVLAPEATAVVSLPNVQCAEVVGPLLLGRFDYAPSGVLDHTHLRFFTRATGRDLVRSSGLEIVAEAERRIGESRGRPFRALARALGPFGIRQLVFLSRRPGSGRTGPPVLAPAPGLPSQQ